MDEDEMMNRVLIRSIDDLMNNSADKEKVAEDMLKRLDKFDFGKTFGPVFYGLRLGGANDEEIIGVLDSLSSLICFAKRSLEDHAYEYRIQEDE